MECDSVRLGPVLFQEASARSCYEHVIPPKRRSFLHPSSAGAHLDI